VVARPEPNPSTPTPSDISALFVIAIAAGPFLLPVLGVDVGDIAFAVPALVLGFATLSGLAAAGRAPTRRAVWVWLAIAAAAATAASGVAVASALANLSLKGAFYIGFAGTAALVAAALQLARFGWPRAKPEQFFDGLLVGMLVVALGLYYVAGPGFAHGDRMLTIVFLGDLVALLLALPAARSVGWGIGGPLVGMLASAVLGDGMVAARAAGQISVGAGATAALWAVAGGFLLLAASRETGARDVADASTEDVRWPYARALFPLPVVLAFAGPGIVEISIHGAHLGPIAYFGTWFLIALGLGFARQAYLVVDNRRTAAQERRVRAVATRRNEDLEALTGLAATLTESFEEDAIIERGLEVLRIAARATSAALHADASDAFALRAITGRWQSEATWAEVPDIAADFPELVERGGRQVVRMPLVRREVRLGLVTLIRPSDDPFDDEEITLLRLLVAQLAIALQNVRDYQERLDQAIRDPLTGVYNRRFLLEALQKDIDRQSRSHSAVSLVLFDLDDFKRINDRHGHGVGDDVLRRFADIAEGLIRPMDSLARVGGEEFALLLPETDLLDALLVAERVRAALSRGELVPGVTVRVSAGISSCPGDGATVDELHKRADDALYWAKRNGKNICALARETAALETDDEREHAVAHLYSLVEMIDRRLRTSDHSENVANYAAALAKNFGVDTERIVRLRRAALLHDIGKVAVTSEILGKPGALTPEEYAEIQRHPIVGSVILAHAGLHDEAHWIRHHHERIDGTGYPEGLSGDDIPLESRILFVADAFEALTSDRPYRRGVEVEKALAELRRCAGSQFDEDVVERMARLVTDGNVVVAALKDAQGAAA
jgi:diguanylate cyclase (GGDEF)-like protein/putative nucleotidyltransferase with HDIG domain